MKITILGASGGVAPGYESTALLINDRVLLDAGTGALQMSLANMAAIKDIVLSHSHLDHTAALSFLADNRAAVAGTGTLRVHCQPATAKALRTGIFNDAIWPDMEKIVINGKPILKFCAIGKTLAPMRIGNSGVNAGANANAKVHRCCARLFFFGQLPRWRANTAPPIQTLRVIDIIQRRIRKMPLPNRR